MSHAASLDPQEGSGRRSRTYRRREPEQSALHRTLQHHLETFLADADQGGHGLPGFVERELRAFLRCGILAHGFARVRCSRCRFERLVAFSCKGRGFCPSCGGKRMTRIAAHLVDHVVPPVRVRQWVLSLPHRLRYRLAYDHALCSEVLGAFAKALKGSYRHRATDLGIPGGHTGAVNLHPALRLRPRPQRPLPHPGPRRRLHGGRRRRAHLPRAASAHRP